MSSTGSYGYATAGAASGNSYLPALTPGNYYFHYG